MQTLCNAILNKYQSEDSGIVQWLERLAKAQKILGLSRSLAEGHCNNDLLT